jgi:pimeloyl-ACP methyl ester carboxylesterase
MKAGEIDPSESIVDSDGLDKAYASENKIYIEGDTMFVAGTASFGDAVDDVNIPFGRTDRTKRYEQASMALAKNPQIRRVVGHSLGGAVSLQIAQQHGLVSRTYGAPVMSFSGGDRYRGKFDPVSMFDYGAKTKVVIGNPHGYSELADKTYKPPSDVGKNSFDKNGVVNMYR